MNIKLGQTCYFDFICNTTAGAVSDADSTPSVDVFEESTDTAIITPPPSKRTAKTGNYRVQVDVTAANGFEIGKSYNVVATATVGGTQSKAVIATFIVDNIVLKTGAVVADGGNTSSSFKTDLASGVSEHHKDALLVFTSGSLIDEVKKVTAYNGSTKFITTGAFTGIPSAADKFLLLVY